MKIEETSQEASRRRVQLRSLASFASLGGIEARKGGERRPRKRAHSPFYCSGPWRTLSRLAHPRSSRSERKKTETMKKLACIPSVHLLLILPFPSPDASMPRPSPGRTLRTGSCQPCPRARLFVVFLSCCHFLSEGRRLPLSSSCCSSPLSLSLSLFPQSLSLSLSLFPSPIVQLPVTVSLGADRAAAAIPVRAGGPNAKKALPFLDVASDAGLSWL